MVVVVAVVVVVVGLLMRMWMIMMWMPMPMLILMLVLNLIPILIPMTRMWITMVMEFVMEFVMMMRCCGLIRSVFLCNAGQGFGKRIGVRSFRILGRGCLGTLAIRLRSGDSLAFMGMVGLEGRDEVWRQAPSGPSLPSGDIVTVSRDGLIQRNAVSDISLQGRHARGSALMRLQVSKPPILKIITSIYVFFPSFS